MTRKATVPRRDSLLPPNMALEYHESGGIMVNKAHAAAYAVVSYITAWLKLHFFKEYICAAITTQTDKKEQLSMDCHSRGVRIYPPDINTSENDYSLFKDGIIPGISSIKGIDKASGSILDERLANGPFVSIYDLIDRCGTKKDVLEALIHSGACDSLLSLFNGNRDIASATGLKYLEVSSKLRDAKTKLNEWTEKQAQDPKEAKAKAKHVQEYSARCDEISAELVAITKTGNVKPMSVIRRLSYESELIGMWVTGNPMDDYELEAGKYKTVEDIATMNEKSRVTIAGFVTNVKKLHTKKDGHGMCVFTLIDRNGSRIKGIAFPTSYEQYGALIRNNTVIEISGSVMFDEQKKESGSESGEDAVIEEPIRQISVGYAERLNQNKQVLFINAFSMEQLADVVLPILRDCSNPKGMPVRLHERTSNGLYKFDGAVESTKCIPMLSEAQIEYCVND